MRICYGRALTTLQYLLFFMRIYYYRETSLPLLSTHNKPYTLVQSLQAEAGISTLSLHMDSRQAQFCLRSAGSVIDRVIGEGIMKVRQYLSCTRTCPRCPRTPRNWQTASHIHPSTHPAADPAPLAVSQLSWVQEWVPQDNLRCPAITSTSVTCKINAL
jgi:hypothetical protein